MSGMAFQIELARAAKRKGKQPNQLTNAEILAVSLSVRKPAQILADGIKAGVSLTKTTLGFRVPLPVLQGRTSSCKTCEHHEISANGSIVCMWCGCCGVLMNAALKDPAESCRLPAARRRWGPYLSLVDTGLADGTNRT